jgi:hypothetical protein
MSDIEIWKSIEGFDGFEISSHGRFKSTKTQTIYKQSLDYKGVARVRVLYKGKKITFNLNRLVALSFIPNTENKPQVIHIDGVKTNNHFTNLMWATNSETQHHMREIGVIKPPPQGGNNSMSRKVKQYDIPSLKLVKTWDCINDVERVLGIPRQNIIKTCKRKRITAGNFIWRYNDDEIKSQQCPSCSKVNKILNLTTRRWGVYYIQCTCGYNFQFEP